MKNTKAIGKIISKVDSEPISGLMGPPKTNFLETDTLATGNLARDADLAHFTIQMEVSMKVNGRTIISTAREYLHLKMDLNISVHLIRIVW